MSAILLIGAVWAHGGHLVEAPWRACDGAAIGDRCAYEVEEGSAHREASGTCRAVSGGQLCVRNRPLGPRREGASGASADRPLSASVGGAGGSDLLIAGLAGIGLAGWILRRKGALRR